MRTVSDKTAIEDYRARLVERAQMRAVYAKLADKCDAVLTLAATDPAPQGGCSTGRSMGLAPRSSLTSCRANICLKIWTMRRS